VASTCSTVSCSSCFSQFELVTFLSLPFRLFSHTYICIYRECLPPLPPLNLQSQSLTHPTLEAKKPPSLRWWRHCLTRSHRKIPQSCSRAAIPVVARRGCVGRNCWLRRSRRRVRVSGPWRGSCGRGLSSLMLRYVSLSNYQPKTRSFGRSGGVGGGAGEQIPSWCFGGFPRKNHGRAEL
jgi:hypothetical protein